MLYYLIFFFIFRLIIYLLENKSNIFYSSIMRLILNTGSTTVSVSGCAVNKEISLRKYGIRIATLFFDISSFFKSVSTSSVLKVKYPVIPSWPQILYEASYTSMEIHVSLLQELLFIYADFFAEACTYFDFPNNIRYFNRVSFL